MNLAKFVAIYKSLLLLQRQLNGGKGQRPHDTFFAGLLGGYVVFGERNAINEQVRTASLCYCLPPPQSFLPFFLPCILCIPPFAAMLMLMAAVFFVIVVLLFPNFIDF